MKFLILISLLFFIQAKPVSACMGYSLESVILFDSIPAEAKAHDIIAKVILLENNTSHWFYAVVDQVIQGDLKKGQKIKIMIQISSCGPNHQIGETGILVAKKSGEEGGVLLLQPYSKRRDGENFKLEQIR